MTASVAIDVGGTFTDVILRDAASGELTIAKVLSSAPDPTDGVLDGFAAALDRAGVEAAALTDFVHASTVVSNLVLERKGPRTALITTAGFRDVLHLQRQKRADLYDLGYAKPQPLVDRRDIFEVRERLAADGEVLTPLDEEGCAKTLEEIAARGIESVAVVFLHAYANAAHERAVGAVATRVAPNLKLSLSSEVSPKLREYERASTTVLNAYTLPAVSGYLDRMESEVRERGTSRPLHVMQCSGGVMLAETIKRVPVNMLESGPAAGALAAAAVGRAAGRERVIGFDMGGTTAKVSIVEGGQPVLVESFEVAHGTRLQVGSGLPITVPAVDLIEIGTGGGSVAHLELGVLAVGPHSAGASPGPACYGRGGEEATVTDANLVLGYLSAENFLGGEMALDVEAGRAAIEERVAKPLGIDVAEAAYAIHRVATTTMASAMRVMTIQRGFDPRSFVAVALGGAGPSHVAGIAADCGMEELIVPANAGVASALGLLSAPVKFELARTLLTPLDAAAGAAAGAVLSELEAAAAESLRASGVESGWTMLRQLRLRYVGQGYEITVAAPPGALGPVELEAIRAEFLQEYARLYGFADPDGGIEVVDWRLTASGPVPPAAVDAGLAADHGREAAEATTRLAYFGDGYVETTVYKRAALDLGREIEGPAVIEERESTTLLPPDTVARLDAAGSLLLDLRGVRL
jgi:N-methylhydantoinase A/oxoprolinase/acetone carboxylase beta subunit